MSALVVDIARVRRAVGSAHLYRETREQAVARTLRKIHAEDSDQQQHATTMATRAYDVSVRRYVGAYTAPGGAP